MWDNYVHRYKLGLSVIEKTIKFTSGGRDFSSGGGLCYVCTYIIQYNNVEWAAVHWYT